MLNHTNEFGGIVYSQKVLLTLVEKGLTREQAYIIVQRNALDAFQNHGDFKANLYKDKEVCKYLSKEDIEDIFMPDAFLKNVDEIYSRVL